MSIVPVEQPSSAIEPPAAVGANDHAPKPPQRSLNGVLNWLVEQTPDAISTAANDVDNAHVVEAMDEERREFLRKVLADMESSDYLGALKDAIKTLTDPESAVQDKLDALEDMVDECEDLNVAQDFVTIGGLPVVTTSLVSPNADMVWRAADVVAVLTQNNPKCQQQARDNNIMALVVPLLSHDNDKVRLKAIRAISSMTRGSTDLLQDFLSHDNAIPSLVACIDKQHTRLSVKALVMCTHLIRMQPGLSAHLREARLPASVATVLLDDQDAQLWEYGLQVLTQLQKQNNNFISSYQKDQPELFQACLNRQQVLSQLSSDDKAAHREEIQFLNEMFAHAQL